ncbi:MAG: transcriptional repressor [Bryobacteraceae bacterium]|nr:transcriptional repressor [Bryobacteraceae bacterium]
MPFPRRPLIDELSRRGVRITAQRRAVLETMEQAHGHLDAAELLARASKRAEGLDRATVYRTIDLLKRLGLVDELDLMHVEGEKHYYEIRSDKEHAHATCVECGRVEEFDSPLLEQIRKEISRELGFVVEVARLEIGGRCAQCRASAREGAIKPVSNGRAR